MTPTGDPRCPHHPQYGVDRLLRTNLPDLWVCSVCSRPLGLATVHQFPLSLEIEKRGPRCRRTPQDMLWAAVDFRWLLRRGALAG